MAIADSETGGGCRMDFPALRDFYHSQLTGNIVPFWLKSIDHEHGGFIVSLDRDGRVYDHDKICTWNQGRMVWVFAMLYNSIAPAPEYYDAAAQGIDFIKNHAFAPDGRMYYSLDREGNPLAVSRGVFPELFAALGFAEFATIEGDDKLWREGRELLMKTWDRIREPATTPCPFVRETRPVLLHGPFLITLNVAQTFLQYRNDAVITGIVDGCIDRITTFFAASYGGSTRKPSTARFWRSATPVIRASWRPIG